MHERIASFKIGSAPITEYEIPFDGCSNVACQDLTLQSLSVNWAVECPTGFRNKRRLQGVCQIDGLGKIANIAPNSQNRFSSEVLVTSVAGNTLNWSKNSSDEKYSLQAIAALALRKEPTLAEKTLALYSKLVTRAEN